MARLRRLPLGAIWHPLAFAAWPVVNLYQGNVGETPTREAVQLSLFCMAVAAVLLVTASLVLRSVRRGALVASVIVLTVMLWGAVRDATSEPTWLFPVWLIGALLLVVLMAL